MDEQFDDLVKKPENSVVIYQQYSTIIHERCEGSEWKCEIIAINHVIHNQRLVSSSVQLFSDYTPIIITLINTFLQSPS